MPEPACPRLLAFTRSESRFPGKTRITEHVLMSNGCLTSLRFNQKTRRHPDSNWGIEVLQTSALPLGYAAPDAQRSGDKS